MPPLLRRNPSRHPAYLWWASASWSAPWRNSTRTFGSWISCCPPRRPDLCPPAPSALALPTAASIGQGSVQSISLHQSPW